MSARTLDDQEMSPDKAMRSHFGMIHQLAAPFAGNQAARLIPGSTTRPSAILTVLSEWQTTSRRISTGMSMRRSW